MSDVPSSDDRAPLKVALVVGLSHSGTTMLDLTLGSHPEVVGVGEIYNFGRRWRSEVQAGLRMPCVCGADVSECELWGAVVAGATDCTSSEESIRHTYAELAHRFGELWPNGVLLDSSKKLESIDLIRELPDVDLRVLLVVRDVRGWVASARDRHRKRYRKRMGAVELGVRTRLRSAMGMARTKVPTGLAKDWYKSNLAYLERLEERNVPYHIVSYERLCLRDGRHAHGDRRVLGHRAAHVAFTGRFREPHRQRQRRPARPETPRSTVVRHPVDASARRPDPVPPAAPGAKAQQSPRLGSRRFRARPAR